MTSFWTLYCEVQPISNLFSSFSIVDFNQVMFNGLWSNKKQSSNLTFSRKQSDMIPGENIIGGKTSEVSTVRVLRALTELGYLGVALSPPRGEY